MKRSIYWMGAVFGLVTSLVAMALAYLANAFFSLPFFPFDLFDWLTRHLPGALIDTSIRTMVSIITVLNIGPTDSVAKLAEQIQSLIVVLVIGIVLGLVLAVVGRIYHQWLLRAGIIAGIVLWLGMAAVEFSLPVTNGDLLIGMLWLLVLFVATGWFLARLLSRYVTFPVSVTPMAENPAESAATPLAPASARGLSRRDFIALTGGGVASLIVLGLGLRSFRQQSTAPAIDVPVTGSPSAGGSGAVQPTAPAPLFGPQYTSGPDASPSVSVLAERIAAAPGTRPEITPVDKFYRIDINALPPVVDSKGWNLNIKGLVQKPLTLSLANLRARPSITQAVTMQCISNPVGGDLTGTNFWTGVPFKDVLAEAGLAPNAKGVAISAVDGFYEYVPLNEAMDERTLLVYAMNGEPLTVEHGFPLRIYIPNHYGMKQPKWITDMQVTDTSGPGYWVDRGWVPQAIVKTVSVIDTTQVDKTQLQQNGSTALGGIAWAGERGISKVEVQVDNGDWVEAALRTPTFSPLTWVQWRYDWKAVPGRHTIAVRATDGQGNLQETAPSDPGPDGATGIDTISITV
jgi:DMSO/TMAO reductase YedYZ molybdopterin-dependent catalytic subunit